MTSPGMDLDETARLVLMLNPRCGMLEFANELRANASHFVDLAEIGALWRRYRGFDGRTSPTHDVETGRLLTTGW